MGRKRDVKDFKVSSLSTWVKSSTIDCNKEHKDRKWRWEINNLIKVGLNLR